MDTVGKDPLGIGFSNLNSTFDSASGKLVDGIAVPPLTSTPTARRMPTSTIKTRQDAVKVIADGTYPSPPARFENLATKGQAHRVGTGIHQLDPDRRPEYLDEAGYVPLTAEQQTESLEKLK